MTSRLKEVLEEALKLLPAEQDAFAEAILEEVGRTHRLGPEVS
jgi:hypothetical protein